VIGDRGSGAGPALQPSGSTGTLLRLTATRRKEIRKEERGIQVPYARDKGLCWFLRAQTLNFLP